MLKLYGAKIKQKLLPEFRNSCFVGSAVKNTIYLTFLLPTMDVVRYYSYKAFHLVQKWKGKYYIINRMGMAYGEWTTYPN